MNTLIWKRGPVTVWLTDESPASSYGFPVVRIHHPNGNADLGPADMCPCPADEQPATAAELVCRIHRAEPLKRETLTAARAFLEQWPQGPRLPSGQEVGRA